MWYRPWALPAAPSTKLALFASLAWFVVVPSLTGLLWFNGDGEGRGLVPAEHHPPVGTHVRLNLQAEADRRWEQIVDQLGPLLPEHRPLATPPTEASAWQATNQLYLHGAASTATLAARLEPTVLRDTVASLRARLASPLFAVGEEDPRRDPLGLADAVESATSAHPSATASGDLLSADGRTLLVYLRTQMPPMRLHAWVSAQLAARFDMGSGIDVRVLPITTNTLGGTRSTRSVVDLLCAGLAALLLVLALGLRRVRAAIVIVMSIAVDVPLIVLLAGATDSLAAPLVMAALGVAASLAVPVARGTSAASALRGATALLPLLLLPYPVWQRWALAWLLGVLALAVVLRRVTPAMLRWIGARDPGVGAGSPGRPWPRAAALVVCVTLLAGGSWSLRHVSGDILAVGQTDTLLGEFFTPARLAELRSVGSDAAEALTAAAEDAAALHELQPEALRWIDAPGMFVRGEAACAARFAELKPLDLTGRVEHLRALLTAQGLRADAFGEALRGLDPEQQPTPEEALSGPLAAWFAAHLEQDEQQVAAISRVELQGDLDADVVWPAGLHGPAVFEHREQRASGSRLGLAVAVGAWLAAFLTWLTARRLSTAITAGLIGVTTQAGGLVVAVLAGYTTLALLLPPLLLIGALAADGAARACQPAPRDSRDGLALACVLAPALVLVASAEPAWRGFGLVLGFGAVLGFTLARAAPGLCALLRRGEAGET